MTVAELVDSLRSLNVHLARVGDKLRVNAAPGVITPELREELSRRKPEILAWLAEASAAASAAPALVRAGRPGPHPLAPAQERIWFAAQLDPTAAAYNMAAALHVDGPLDPEALAQALSDVVARHEILRTSFPVQQGRPVQAVAAAAGVALARHDLAALPPPARADRVDELARAEARRPFDLAVAPLLRATLVRLGPAEHLLLLVLHHLVLDGWSMAVLSAEVSACYAARAGGQGPGAAPLPLQYADFTEWHNAWLESPAAEAQAAYWRRQLHGASTALDLPTDRPRPPQPSYRGGVARFDVPPALLQAVARLARDADATPFMVLLAAFQALLYRHSGAADFLVGSPLAGRPHPDLERLVGCFVNVLPLRADLSGRPAFRELLARVRSACLGAYDHQLLPADRALAAGAGSPAGPLRALSVLFTLQNAPRPEQPLPGLRVELRAVDGGTAKFDLALTLEESGGGLAGSLEYAADLYDAASADRLAARYRTLLQGAVADPAGAVDDLPLLAPGEQEQLARWNDTAAELPGAAALLDELVARQAALHPEAEAVAWEQGTLCHAELDARANRLAHLLQRDHRLAPGARPGPEPLVAVLMERSPELVVALLGVLRAGAAFVPIDPTYPAERIAFMLADTGVAAVLTQGRLRQALPDGAAPVLALDELEARLAALPATPPPNPRLPDRLAYVIYTSGSTGRPKGAGVSHRSAVNRLCWMRERFPLAPGERVLHQASIGFDVSVWEIFWPLVSGAAVYLSRPEAQGDARYLAEVVASRRITALHFVASLMQALMAATTAARCPALRIVIYGGEVLPVELAVRFVRQFGPILHNLYGPTEAAIDVTSWTCSAADGARATIPLGRPHPNVAIHVVDGRGRLAPVGVPGELCIAGVQVGRGYHRRPGLTADRFVPDPFSAAPGARMYRTGDLARWLPEGLVEFLGRGDQQVKIRGVRIELGEIESALLAQPGVRQAAVLARGEGDDRHLVAYVSGSGLAVEALRAGLLRRLPLPLVPARYLVLPALPITSSGKLDRRNLPDPSSQPAAQQATRSPALPADALEERLLALWRQVLELEEAGPADDFFALGGHSMKALRLLGEVQGAFAVRVSLRQFFAGPTVREMAAAIRAAGGGEPAPPEDEPAALGGAAPAGELSVSQRRLAELYAADPESTAFLIAGALAWPGALDPEIFRRALAALVERHEALRTGFPRVNGRFVQQVSERLPLNLAAHDLSALEPSARERERERLGLEVRRRPFRLEEGGLYRVALLRLGPDTWEVVAAIHHIVADGWSVELIWRDLEALYAALSTGAPPALPPVRAQLRHYVAWHNGLLAGEGSRARGAAYWAGALAGARRLDLPYDREPGPTAAAASAAYRSFLEGEAAVRLGALAKGSRSALSMALLAVYFQLLHEWTGATDLVTAIPSANRTRPEFKDTVGFLVDSVLVRCRVTPGEPFTALLRRVTAATFEALEAAWYPIELACAEVGTTWGDLLSTFFNATTLGDANRAPARDAGPRHLAEVQRAKFPLVLYLTEHADGVSVQADYHRDRFDPETIGALVERYLSIARRAAEQG